MGNWKYWARNRCLAGNRQILFCGSFVNRARVSSSSSIKLKLGALSKKLGSVILGALFLTCNKAFQVGLLATCSIFFFLENYTFEEAWLVHIELTPQLKTKLAIASFLQLKTYDNATQHMQFLHCPHNPTFYQ